MTLIPGHEDMQCREVLGVDQRGRLLVDYGDEGYKRYKLIVGPSGALKAEPLPDEKKDNGVDQVGGAERTSLAQRLAGLDQT